MIVSTQIKSTQIFKFIAFLVFKLLSHKVLFINRNYNRNGQKWATFYEKSKFYR